MLASLFTRLSNKSRLIPPPHRPQLIVGPQHAVADFRPAPEETCFCSSGKTFALCCGARAEKRPPPYGVFVEEDYLSLRMAKELRHIADKCYGERLKVIGELSAPGNMVMVEDTRRVSDHLVLDEHQTLVNTIVKTAFRELTGRYIGRRLEWYELPQILRYKPGGFYAKHADSDNFDSSTQRWNRTIDRDLSLLIYLNDDYEGGTLWFENFNFRLRPKAGMAVLFPSDSRFVHEAEMLTRGQRYVIVSWAAVKGVSKVAPRPPEIAQFF